MKIFALSDFHLSFQTDKPMDVFGDGWNQYEDEIKKNWNAVVTPDDIGIIAGDISWAMRMEDACEDFKFINKLNGRKIIIRGNHDYWWKSIGKVRDFVNDFPVSDDSEPNIFALQNDSVKIGNFVFAGTRGWRVPERRQLQSDEDKKIYDREILRLELALKDAMTKKSDGDKLIVILHYPPFNCVRDDSPFTKLCEEYAADAVVYGHLHGKCGRGNLICTKNNIKYYLSSTDLLEHKPVNII
jgi:predicted phosphohydrolase